MRPWPIALALASCGFPSIDNEVVTQGRHITMHADPSLPICAASIDQADLLVENTAALLKLPVPAVDVYVYAPGVSVCSAGNSSADCTSGTTVYSGRWPHDHELIHTVEGQLGRAPAFVQEGLAEGLTSGAPLDPSVRATASPTLESVAFFAGDIPEHYREAADFTRYVLTRFGVDSYERLYGLLFFDDALTTRQIFQHEMGTSIDRVIADWRATPAPSADASLATFARCMGDPLPPTQPGLWSVDEQADCLASVSTQTLNQKRRHIIEIEEPSVVSLRLRKPDTVAVLAEILSCTPTLTFGLDVGDVRRMELTVMGPGRKVLELQQDADVLQDAPTHWDLTSHGAPSARCDAASVITVPTTRPYQLQLTGHPSSWAMLGDRYELWLRVEQIASTLANARFYDQTGASTAQLCTGTCDALSCVDARALDKLPITPQAPLFVHLSAPASEAESTIQFDLNY